MEKNVRLGCVVATMLWAGSVLLTLFGSVAALETDTSVSLVLLSHAVLCMGAAATLTVRNLFNRQNQLIHDAFVMGQEVTTISRRLV